MKKYKLIKEYPGSPEIGATTNGFYDNFNTSYKVINANGFFFGKMNRIEIETYPEFWEEVKEVEEIRRLFANSMDECPIYYGDQYYYIDSDYRLHTGVQLRYNPELCPKELIFKNKLKAEEYIWDNRPVFSRKEILNAISRSEMSDHALISKTGFLGALKYWR